MCCARMSPAAPSPMGTASSGMRQIHPGPAPTPPARGLLHPLPQPSREPGAADRKSHTKALSDTHKFAQAYVNHTKTDKFSY